MDERDLRESRVGVIGLPCALLVGTLAFLGFTDWDGAKKKFGLWIMSTIAIRCHGLRKFEGRKDGREISDKYAQNRSRRDIVDIMPVVFQARLTPRTE